jgi:protocatechuate 3,4-dioxygenase alpha subunit
MARLTPAQTIGPFFHEGMRWAIRDGATAVPASAVRIAGRVLDREGAGVSDALLEVWQPAWQAGSENPVAGLQRVATDDSGRFAFLLPRPTQKQSHAHVTVFARGLLRGLFTRVYLGDPESLVLPGSVPAGRRGTLIARPDAANAGYEWDVHLSGPDETVFFEL